MREYLRTHFKSSVVCSLEGSASTEIDTSQPQTPTLNERFSRNLMQLVLDASSALRRGDQDTVNAILPQQDPFQTVRYLIFPRNFRK